jgi:AcrR family transcriptional regulator
MPERTASKPRAQRLDAQRNRARVLEVAQAVFARVGSAATMDEIAREAGLGVGTLYRHFPTKEALLESIVRERLTQVVGTAEALEQGRDPGAALRAFLERLVDESEVRKHLADALSSANFDWNRARGTLDVREALARLLARAQRAKQVRRDVTVDEVLALLAGHLVAIERFAQQSASRAKLLQVLHDGLRPR